ncbi:uncharacterized protein ATC70_006700 [Mucor velutinosus]|uniref:Uncharacterized protein n=1 Tax=Mucor velutinosus TaxID=708070 RepID=A0AAN7HW54_9FUNG|nr:hypothetical protein ATC70_006700 [Mucor velutinosus]
MNSRLYNPDENKPAMSNIFPFTLRTMKTPSLSIRFRKRCQKNRLSMPILVWSMPSSSSSPNASGRASSHSNLSSLRSMPSYQTDLVREHSSQELKVLQEQINGLAKKLVSAEEALFQWKTEFYDLQNRFQEVLNEHDVATEDTRQILQESEHVRSKRFMTNASSIAIHGSSEEEQEQKSQDHRYVHRASLRSLSRIKVLRFFKRKRNDCPIFRFYGLKPLLRKQL